MTSKKVTSIFLICVFVMRTSRVVKMPVLSLLCHLISESYWMHYVSSWMIISDQTLFGSSVLKSEHTAARRSFHSYMKSLGNFCAKTWIMHWPSHKIRPLFGLSKFSSRITLGTRKEVGTRFRPVWTFSSDVCSSDDHLPLIPRCVDPVSTIFAHRNAWFLHRFCTFCFREHLTLLIALFFNSTKFGVN